MPIFHSINELPKWITSTPPQPNSVQSLQGLYLKFDSRPDRNIVSLRHKLWKIPLTANIRAEAFQPSRDLPLGDVVIDVPTGTIGKGWNDFIQTVVARSNRWRIFEITWEPTDLLFQGSSDSLHKLEKPALCYLREDGGPTAGVYHVLFGREVPSPLLWIIRPGATYRRYSQMQSLAHNLVELHFGGPTNSHTLGTLGDIVDLLRASPKLQVLTFFNTSLERTNSTNRPQPEPVKLQDLSRLGFRGCPEDTRDLLSLLHVPGLEKFLLGKLSGSQDSTGSSTTTAMRSVTEGFMRPPNQVEKLGALLLEYDECQEATMRMFLEFTPGVEIFCTSSPTALPILANDLNILPALRHFVVKSSIFCGANSNTFSTILTHRPEVKLYVEGDFMQDGERLYSTLRLDPKIKPRMYTMACNLRGAPPLL